MNNKYLFVSLFFLLLLSLSCVSAANDVNSNCTNYTMDCDIKTPEGNIKEFNNEYSLNEDYNGNFNVFNSLKENISSNNKGSSTKIKTTIQVSNFVKFYSESGTLYAYLKNSKGKALSGKTLVFTVNGVSYNKKTDSNGRAGLPINLLPKSYNAKVSFFG